MWIWHRKMTPENGGLRIIKPATKVLTLADLPPNWRDHIEVVTHKRSKVRINEVSDERLDIFETLTSAQTIIPLDGKHKAVIEALQQSGYTTLWVSDHNLLTDAHLRAQKAHGRAGQGIATGGRVRDQLSRPAPGHPQLLHVPVAQWRVAGLPILARHLGSGDLEPGRQGMDDLLLQSAPDLPAAAKLHGGLQDPEKKGYTFSNPEDAMKAAKMLGQPETTIDSLFAGRRHDAQTRQGRPPDRRDRTP